MQIRAAATVSDQQRKDHVEWVLVLVTPPQSAFGRCQAALLCRRLLVLTETVLLVAQNSDHTRNHGTISSKLPHFPKDSLGLEKVSVQARRWRNAVRRSEPLAFVVPARDTKPGRVSWLLKIIYGSSNERCAVG